MLVVRNKTEILAYIMTSSLCLIDDTHKHTSRDDPLHE